MFTLQRKCCINKSMFMKLWTFSTDYDREMKFYVIQKRQAI